MRWLFVNALCLCARISYAQPNPPVLTLRLSVLVVPFTPLLTVEGRIIGKMSVQGETNFSHTHGVNIKYYLRSPLERGYVFVGTAFVRNNTLRNDGRSTLLPYAGWGYAHVMAHNWVIDSRLGIGPTLNADKNRVYPVLKIGIGKRF